MRIVHWSFGRVNPESSNGVDKTVYALARAQATLGHQVAVFSITPLQAIPIPGVEVRTYPPRTLLITRRRSVSKRRGMRNPLRLPTRLVEELHAWSPDIVHFHSVHIPEAIWTARRLDEMGIPYCVTPHGGLTTAARSRRGHFRKMLFVRLIERRYLQRARFLHAVSRAEVQIFPPHGVSTPTVIAPNCFDTTLVPAHGNRRLLRHRFAETERTRLIVYLGRLDPQHKGLDLLLRAWSRLGDEGSMRLILVGPDWRGQRRTLEDLARSLGVDGSIAFVGPAHGEDKWGMLTAGDIFVHPSRWEAGVPFAVLEAMAAGVPVLLTEACDPDGLIRRHAAGIVVPASTAGLAQGLEEIAAAPDSALREMGVLARLLVEEEFRWERTAQTLVEAYRGAAADPARRT